MSRYYKNWPSGTIWKKKWAAALLRLKHWKRWKYHSKSSKSIVVLLDIQHPHNWHFFDTVGKNHIATWLDKVGKRILITARAQIVIFFINLVKKLISIIIIFIFININGITNLFLFFKIQQFHRSERPLGGPTDANK